MGSEDEYTSRIRMMGWARLRAFHERLIEGRVEGWEPGKAFEYLILRAFELEGAVVEQGLGQHDLLRTHT